MMSPDTSRGGLLGVHLSGAIVAVRVTIDVEVLVVSRACKALDFFSWLMPAGGSLKSYASLPSLLIIITISV